MAGRSIFVSVPHGTSAGNMLRAGGLLTRVLDADRSLDVVLLSPMARDAAFVREFSRERIQIVDLPGHTPAGLEARLLAIVQASYLSRGQTESVRIRLAEARANGIIRALPVKAAIGKLLVEPFTHNGSRYALSDRLVSHPAMERLFDEHRPMLVVAANPGLVFSEVPLLRTARRRGVFSMAIDPSWDNFTNKLIPVRQVDRLVVWNDIMKSQAIELHGYGADAIRVAGAPQFDPHFRARTPREEFFRRIGADPSRKLIALTTTPRSLYRHHDHVLRALVPAIRGGALAGAQILVRLHPRDEMDAYREFDGVAGRDHREAVPRHREGGRRPGHRRDARESAPSWRHAELRRRRRQCRVDDQHRGLHFRHAGREHLLRWRRGEPVRAVGASLLLVYALREHHVARSGAGGDVAGRNGRDGGSLPRRPFAGSPPAAGRSCWINASSPTADRPSASIQCVLDELGRRAPARAA